MLCHMTYQDILLLLESSGPVCFVVDVLVQVLVVAPLVFAVVVAAVVVWSQPPPPGYHSVPG